MEIAGRIRSWLGRVRHKPDILLHPRRRRQATERLLGTRPRRVLFICHGNICRSPYAAAAFARVTSSAGLEITTMSAGFVGAGRPSPNEAIAVARSRGVDLSPHRSMIFTNETLATTELIVVVSADQANGIRSRTSGTAVPILVLGDLDPLPGNRRTIIDPWNRDTSVFEESYNRIDRCVAELARIITV